ncbi:MAG: histidine phosphatase family protein [Gammaproteobacteria bacterium]|nr:histidine phosphatase family protein [Gammaproteobacteria bacterium]
MRLLRHPRTQAPPGLCYGRFDPPPASDALASVEALLPDLLGIAKIITSPSPRCALPAQRLAARLDCRLVTDVRLQELDFGQWEGCLWQDLDRRESDHWAADPLHRAPPGGESFAALQSRVYSVLDELARDDAASNASLLVTHAGPIRAIWMRTSAMSFDQAFRTPVPYATLITPLRSTPGPHGEP